MTAKTKQQNKKISKLRFSEFSGEWEEKGLREVVNCLDNKRISLNKLQRNKGRC